MEECNCKAITPGTVLLSFKLSIGKVGITQVPLFTNEAIAALPIKSSKLTKEFLYWALQSVDLIQGTDKAVKGLTLNKPKLLNLEIPLPPLDEQKRLAAILDRADELRRLRRITLERLDELAQSLFLELFGDPATNPKAWNVVPLQEVILNSPQNGIYKPQSAYGEGTSILRIDAFNNGTEIDFPKLKRVRLEPKEIELYGLCRHDIVINRVNSRSHLGKSALIPALVEPTVFESNMMRFAINESKANPKYLIFFLQTAYVKSQILMCCKDAVNQSSINQKDVQGFLIGLPPLALQKQFAEQVEELEAIKSRARASLAEQEALFAALQSRAFSGEL